MNSMNDSFIDENSIASDLAQEKQDASAARSVLEKARTLCGLDPQDAATLINNSDWAITEELFETARFIKETIYGKRVVLFAPLYISNKCANECAYCAFRSTNSTLRRTALDTAALRQETEYLIRQGHKRILLVSGELPADTELNYICNAIDTVYAAIDGKNSIRRINVNIAPLSTVGFKKLAQHAIGTYQLFQETYHRPTYVAMHTRGPKADYKFRLNVMDRAMEAGINDVGIGTLFGLYDWRFELLSLLHHARHLESTFGAGPHTISVPRIEPAHGSAVAAQPPYAVHDDDFKKIIAILRCAVPYTGIILSTREQIAMRQECLALGVSQISAGSCTDPGGYTAKANHDGQFSLGDHRPLNEVIDDLITMGYIPSFCTGCYRMGRTGADFMDLAKPGAIKNHCDPNALSTFKEYLLDYASPATRAKGERLITDSIKSMNGIAQTRAQKMVDMIDSGKRDEYC